MEGVGIESDVLLAPGAETFAASACSSWSFNCRHLRFMWVLSNL